MDWIYSQLYPPLIPIDTLLPGGWRITMQLKVIEGKHVEGKGDEEVGKN